MVCNRSREKCKSWQIINFRPLPVVYIRIVGTDNTANEVFHCVHFECPAQVDDELKQDPATSESNEVPSGSTSSTTKTSQVLQVLLPSAVKASSLQPADLDLAAQLQQIALVQDEGFDNLREDGDEDVDEESMEEKVLAQQAANEKELLD